MESFLEALISPGSMDIAIMFIIILLKIVIVFSCIMLGVALAPYFERKVIGHMQMRLGPMRVGPHGILQSMADGIKLFFKEDIIPSASDKPVFFIAPVISLFAAMTSLSVLPWFDGFVISDINIGLLFLFAMSSIGAYGIVMAGWASNSKYSFLGGLRASAQVISYEIPLGLSLVGVMIMAGSLNLSEIVRAQQTQGVWYLFPQIIGAFVFFVSALAETNRTPFDMPEAESELVAGHFTEYSGFRFSIFFIAEYIAMFVMAILGVVCFMGGWLLPFVNVDNGFVQLFVFIVKVCAFIFMYFWIRATLPRYRYDQLMGIGWKLLIPLSLLNIVIISTYKMFWA